MMKRKTFFVAALVAIMAIVAFACSKTGGKPTITFDSQGGSAVASISVTAGSTIVEPTAPERDGYRFDGWFSNAAGTGTAYVFSTMPSSDLKLYAKWSFLWTITFETDGGDEIGVMKGAAGEALTLPTPTKTASRFLGWFLDLDESADEFTATVFPDEDITLYAHWAEQRTVSFYIVSGQAAYDTQYVDLGEKVYAPATDPERPGYSFEGWVTDSSGNGAAVDFSAGQTVVRDIAYYGKWLEGQSTLRFNLRGGLYSGSDTIAPMSLLTGDPLTLPQPTKAGATFGGWYLEETLKTKIGGVMPGGDTTVYASWVIPMASSTIDMLAGPFISIVDGMTVTQDVAARTLSFGFAAATKEKYACYGRTIVGNFKNLGYSYFNITFTGTSGVPLKFKVEGDLDAAYEIPSAISCTGAQQTYKFQLAAANLPSTNNGILKLIVFWGFEQTAVNTSATLSISSMEFIRMADEAMPLENVMFFNTNIATQTAPAYFVTGADIVYPDFSKVNPGFHVSAYYTDYAMTQLFEETTMPEGPLQLYLEWAMNDPGEIIFDTDGADNIMFPLEDPVGSIINWSAIVPDKAGYTFTGWYDEYGDRLNETTMKYMPAESITAYAHWTINADATITYVSNYAETIADLVLPYGSRLPALPSPEREGFEFAGWYTDSALTTAFTGTIMPQNGATLYAKWTGTVDLVVTFDAGTGGSVTPASATAKALDTITLPTPTNANVNYWFDGWYLENTYVTKFDGKMPLVAEGFTVYAKWLESEVSTKNDIGTTGWTASATSGSRITVSGSTLSTSGSSSHNTQYAYKNIVWDNTRVLKMTFTCAYDVRARLYVGTTQYGGDFLAAASQGVLVMSYPFAADTNVQLRVCVDPTGTTSGRQAVISDLGFYHGKLAGTADGSEIRFDSNIGSGNALGVVGLPSIYAAAGAAVTAPAAIPVFPGHVFAGWYADAAGETPYIFDTMPSPAGIQIIYATWTANANITITYVVTDGVAKAPAQAPAGGYFDAGTATPSNAAIDPIYGVAAKAFGAWYFDEAFTQPFTGLLPDTDTTLYVRWKVLGNVMDLRSYIAAPSGGTSKAEVDADGNVIFTMTANESGWGNLHPVIPYNPSLHFGIRLTGEITYASGGSSGLLVKPNDSADIWLNTAGISTATYKLYNVITTGTSINMYYFVGPNGGKLGDVYKITEFCYIGYVFEEIA